MIKNHNHRPNGSGPKQGINLSGLLIFAWALTLLFSQPLFGGTPGEYAMIDSDPRVEVIFKQNRLPSEYHYYYTGRSNLPYAVIGIDAKYTLDSPYWNKIELKDQLLEKINHLMPIGETKVTYGRILDSDSDQVGLWFSEYRNTIVRFEAGNRLKVFSPYQPNDRV